jgi:glutathione synthase/RimK-type ligase-like ATP-grasp enzyme
MTVLILGFPRDVHIHAVRWAIEQAGGRHHTVYAPDLPQVLRSSMHITQSSPAVSVRDGRSHGASGDWSTVWFRRSGLPMRPPGMSDADWAVASRECDYHIRNLRQLIAPDAFWVNDIAAREVVLLKMPQLVAAAQCGLAIPETLYSNDPDEIRRFWGEHRNAGVIFKLHLQTHWHAQSSGERHALFTTELRQENLQDDAPLTGCPAIYQRKIEKAYELRVTCMDERCVAIRLDSQSRDSTQLDWRSDMVAPLKPVLVALPRTVEERCIALMRKLGLAFGCIDLIVTPEGEHVFLEVNEMGQFLWVEQDEPRSELLRCFATLLLHQRLGPSTPLVGDETLSYAGFLASGAWERGHAEDGESHAEYSPPGLINEP